MGHTIRSLAISALAVLALAALVPGASLTTGTGTSGSTGATATSAVDVAVAPVAYAGTVYLTFDDGPHATYTPKILAILRKYGVKAVFFEVGQNISYYPSVTSNLRSSGMKIGNHTWSHPDLTTLPTSSVTSQLNRMESALGYRPRCARTLIQEIHVFISYFTTPCSLFFTLPPHSPTAFCHGFAPPPSMRTIFG